MSAVSPRKCSRACSAKFWMSTHVTKTGLTYLPGVGHLQYLVSLTCERNRCREIRLHNRRGRFVYSMRSNDGTGLGARSNDVDVHLSHLRRGGKRTLREYAFTTRQEGTGGDGQTSACIISKRSRHRGSPLHFLARSDARRFALYLSDSAQVSVIFSKLNYLDWAGIMTSHHA